MLRIASLLCFSGLVTTAWPAPAQQPAANLCAWKDRYYAAYSAMSAAPAGAAMEAWIQYFAPFAFFEDPTAGVSAIGHDRIRKPFAEAFSGPMGPIRWTIHRCVFDAEWVAVDGVVDGTYNARPVRARFSTWMKVRSGRIVHQIDYVDYSALTGTSRVDTDSAVTWSSDSRANRDSERGHRVAESFYRHYDALPSSTAAGLDGYLDLLTEDYALEDPTARVTIGSRDAQRTALRDILASKRYGAIHWQLERRISNGEWVAVEGVFRGVYDGRPYGTRFTTWLQVRGDKISGQIDFLDYATFRRQTAPSPSPRP
jgi:ketosteroid isomerase-like protein